MKSAASIARALLIVSLALLAGLAHAEQSPVDVWATLLKPHYFENAEIREDKQVIDLVTPYRAEDAAVTPVRIKAMIPQTPARYIETIYLFVDHNPEPLVGRFTFTSAIGRADLALRVRIDKYTNVRAVAVLNTGEHHMVANFVKAAGGCAAPLATDYDRAMAHLGAMNLKTLGSSAEEPDGGLVAQLQIKHPNITGMQMDYRIYAVRPAHYVKTVKISVDGTPLLTAETGIAISEDPSFRFFVGTTPHKRLTAEVSDSKGKTWSETIELPDHS